ncbi:MAG: hypothetical protein K8R21_07630 [Leptospira sp.]|nr:hypothetical protein [Leptospira sp.]
MPEINSFQRGIPATVAGLVQLVSGSIGSILGAGRILIIGYGEPFKFSFFSGVFNLAFESLSILQWISGIGILRSRKWGYFIGMLWASLTFLFHIIAYLIKMHFLHKFSPPVSLGEFILLYYLIIFTGFCIYQNRRTLN